MINPMDLTGKHVIITGASSGIGRATCIQASKLGAKVSLIARNEDRLRETISLMENNEHFYYVYDLNDVESIENLVKEIVEKNGTVDGLIHCAGFISDRPIKLDTYSAMKSMMQIHFFAFVELLRTLSLKKRMNDGASCIGVSSAASIKGNKAQGAYAAAKGAMNALIHPYAKELAKRKIRVNTIAFAMIETDMYKSFLDVGGNNDDLLREQYLGIIPVEYAANAICFLLSDASRYMTGGTLFYDAGILS